MYSHGPLGTLVLASSGAKILGLYWDYRVYIAVIEGLCKRNGNYYSSIGYIVQNLQSKSKQGSNVF